MLIRVSSWSKCILISLAINAIHAVDEQFCPAGFVQHKEKCYFLNRELLDYVDATHKCENHFFGMLAVIKSEEDQKFLKSYIFDTLRMTQNVWLGARVVGADQEIRWQDGSSISYHNWMTVCLNRQSNQLSNSHFECRANRTTRSRRWTLTN